MSTSEQSPASSSQQQQQQQRVRKPPFADWPTIKILTPPQGRFSPKFDEWCFTYCSQTISGRIHGREPSCNSICIRKVFPHEVRNVLAFKKHQSVGPDGKAKYPLPSEGQSANLPRLLGGATKEDAEDQRTVPSAASTKYWDEGWYLWSGKGRWSSQQKVEQMMLDIPKQQYLEKIRENRKEIWQDYQEQLKNVGQAGDNKPTAISPWWGPLVPPKSIEEAGSPSILIPLPPDVPSLWEKINKLLTPSYRAVSIMHQSITSGEQKEFALRVLEKAQSDEPFILAQRTLSYAYDQWKKRDESEEDEKKGSA